LLRIVNASYAKAVIGGDHQKTPPRLVDDAAVIASDELFNAIRVMVPQPQQLTAEIQGQRSVSTNLDEVSSHGRVDPILGRLTHLDPMNIVPGTVQTARENGD